MWRLEHDEQPPPRMNNLLNLVNYSALDTVVNSPSFGQITSVRQMRTMQLILRFRY